MKNVMFILFFFFIALPVSAYSSKASKFAEIEYAKTNNCEKVHINMKKEYTTESKQKNGQIIVYGWGDIRGKYIRKSRITYVVLMDKSGNPCWSKINFYQ